MGRLGKEVAGQVFSFLGFIAVCLSCGLPMWRVTTYIGANIVSGQIVWDGLWMKCVMQSTGQMQCKIEDSIMSLSQDLQAARALIVISLVVAFIGFILSFIGGKCTSCLKNESSQAKVVILAGVISIIASVVCLIPICWSAVFTISDFQSAAVAQVQKRELGASIYVGWGAFILLFFGGCMLCSSCPPQNPSYGYQGYPPQYAVYPPSTYSYLPAKSYPYTAAPAPIYTAAKRPGSRTYSPQQYL